MSPTIPITSGRQAALLAIVVVSSVLTLLLVCLRYVGRWKRQRRLDYSDLWIGIAEVGRRCSRESLPCRELIMMADVGCRLASSYSTSL